MATNYFLLEDLTTFGIHSIKHYQIHMPRMGTLLFLKSFLFSFSNIQCSEVSLSLLPLLSWKDGACHQQCTHWLKTENWQGCSQIRGHPFSTLWCPLNHQANSQEFLSIERSMQFQKHNTDKPETISYTDWRHPFLHTI